MKCVNCDDIPDKAKFCPYCGTQNEPKQKAAEMSRLQSNISNRGNNLVRKQLSAWITA